MWSDAVISHTVKIWTDLSFVLSQYTRLTDRQTDEQTEFSCIPCSAVKKCLGFCIPVVLSPSFHLGVCVINELLMIDTFGERKS